MIDLGLLVPFRRDAREAQTATPKRKSIFWISSVVVWVAIALSWTILPGSWAWAVIAADLIVFTVLGNHWANTDALARFAAAPETGLAPTAHSHPDPAPAA